MQRNLALAIAAVETAMMVGVFSLSSYAQTPQPVNRGASAGAETHYDWKTSFAKVPTGKVPRSSDGKPNLQGIWSFSTLTPLERRNGQKSTEVTAAAAEEAEDAAQKAAIDLRIEPTITPPGEKTTDAYNSFWRDGYWYKVPMTTLHTSQVVDPPDGRVPSLVAEARDRRAEATMKLDRPAIGPEDRPTTSRCVTAVRAGPPILGNGPGSQETTMQIVQGPGMVVVRQEALHAAQMVYLDDRARPADDVHLNKGVSRGHWDGDVLVVESTNFVPWGIGNFAAYGTTDKLHIIERWKRLDDTHLLYGFTIEDPGTWSKPWSVEYVMWRLTDQEELVEYACHEGNVGVEFTLAAARLKERQALESAEKAKDNEQTSRETLVASAAEPPAVARPAIAPSAITFSSNALGMEFSTIPAGDFQMGCSAGTKALECSNDERPRHSVQIMKPFEIQRTQVTQKQWQEVMGVNPSAHKGDLELPVDQISFLDVQQFLSRLNARNDGFRYRLPTEAEWEYTVRAGSLDPYAASLTDRGELGPRGLSGPHPVASQKPNPWGLYDTRGNVQEWVNDWYDPAYYSQAPAADPTGPAKGELRVVRGASFRAFSRQTYPFLLRVSVRNEFPEAYQAYDVGVRLAREKQ